RATGQPRLLFLLNILLTTNRRKNTIVSDILGMSAPEPLMLGHWSGSGLLSPADNDDTHFTPRRPCAAACAATWPLPRSNHGTVGCPGRTHSPTRAAIVRRRQTNHRRRSRWLPPHHPALRR